MKRILAVAVGPEQRMLRDVVASGEVRTLRPYIAGLVAGLTKLGREYGTDFVIDYTEAPPDLKAAVAKAVEKPTPDLIFAMSTTAVLAAMPTSIPIVFPSVSDPVNDGVVTSCAVPGGNVTGVRAMRTQTADDCLELFKATVPALRIVVGLHKRGYKPAISAFVSLDSAKRRAEVDFEPREVQSHDDIKKQLLMLPQRGNGEIGVLVLPDDLVLSAASMIIEVADQQHLATFFPATDWVKAYRPSALAGFGIPQRVCGEAAAPYVDKILRGASAADLPVKRIGGFEWAVNTTVARALRIGISDKVYQAADRVI